MKAKIEEIQRKWYKYCAVVYGYESVNSSFSISSLMK